MSWRRAVAPAAYAFLLFALVRRTASEDLDARADTIRRAFAATAAERRAAGAAAAYDRGFFQLLEAVRRELPPQTRGLILHAPSLPEWGGLYLAVYHLAPLPVVITPEALRPGWLLLAYRAPLPPGMRVVRRWPDAALLAPP